MKDKVIELLSDIYDPELPVSIWDLGLVYKLDVNADNDVYILMTLTAPNCPIAETLPEEVRQAVQKLPGTGKVTVEVTFEPAWDMSRLSEAAKIELGLF